MNCGGHVDWTAIWTFAIAVVGPSVLRPALDGMGTRVPFLFPLER